MCCLYLYIKIGINQNLITAIKIVPCVSHFFMNTLFYGFFVYLVVPIIYSFNNNMKSTRVGVLYPNYLDGQPHVYFWLKMLIIGCLIHLIWQTLPY